MSGWTRTNASATAAATWKSSAIFVPAYCCFYPPTHAAAAAGAHEEALAPHKRSLSSTEPCSVSQAERQPVASTGPTHGATYCFAHKPDRSSDRPAHFDAHNAHSPTNAESVVAADSRAFARPVSCTDWAPIWPAQ